MDTTELLNVPSNEHKPVLIDKIIEYLPTKPGLKIFDGTFGGGGYAQRFLDLGHLVWACDLDSMAITKFGSEHKNLILKQSSYLNYITQFEDGFFDFIVLDLGFSSNQLSHSNRGFSYQNREEIMDLRYNSETGTPLWKKILRLKKASELSKVIWQNSGESLSIKIANHIFKRKSEFENITVGQFSDMVVEAIPMKFRQSSKKILSRVWQALRIWVNDEFASIKGFLEKAPYKIAKDGLMAIVSFHSLEDKLVTKKFRNLCKPVTIDEFGNKNFNYQLLTKKADFPSEEEIEQNPRSRSAMLRVLKKIV